MNENDTNVGLLSNKEKKMKVNADGGKHF